MSYILDALRRAEAERERGAVPGLNAQPATHPAALPAAPRRRWLPWVAATVLAAAAGAWWFLGASTTPPPAHRTAVPTMPAAVPEPPPAATAVSPSAPPPAPPSSPAPRGWATPQAPATGQATAPARRPPLNPAAPPPALPTAARASAAPEPPANAAVVPIDQLPEDVRRQLPALAIGGSIYSDSPGSRLLIVSGALVHEGDAVAPGVTLEQIRPRSAVLRWKGLRYEQGF